MTLLVTGATGEIGSKVARLLRDGREQVRAFVRDGDRGKELLGPDIEVVVGDFANRESLRDALDGVDRLFLSCSNQPRQIELEMGVIDAAADAGANRVVKLSAIGAGIDAPLTFWQWHGRIEQHLQGSGLSHVVLRPNFYMSNLVTAADQIRELGKLFAPADGARIAMVDPDDVAAAAVAALTADHIEKRVYELSGPVSVTYPQIAADLSNVTGRTVAFVDVPEEQARQGLLHSGTPDWLADGLITLFRLLRDGVLDRTSEGLRLLTGREPRSFTEFAKSRAEVFSA